MSNLFQPFTLLNKILSSIKTFPEEKTDILANFQMLSVQMLSNSLMTMVTGKEGFQEVLKTIATRPPTDAALQEEARSLFEYCRSSLTPDEFNEVVVGSLLSAFLETVNILINTSTPADQETIKNILKNDQGFALVYDLWQMGLGKTSEKDSFSATKTN